MTKILIVEDEAILAADMTNLLTRKGYEVIDTVASGGDAMRAIELQKPDLVFMDIVLDGEQDGIDTARYITTRYDIPIIYLTAHADVHTIKRATLTTPHGYLLKPFNEDAVGIAIEMALTRHGLERKMAERELRYRALFETMANAYALNELAFDDNGNAAGYRLLEMNPVFIDMLATAGVGTDDYVTGLFPDGATPWLEIFRRSAMEGVVQRFEMISPALDRWYSIMVFSTRVGEFSLMLVDVTEIKVYDEKLKKSNEELRNLSAYLETVREEERAAIAREIHDYLGQALTALRIDISWCMRRFGDTIPELQRKGQGMIELVDGTIQSVRTLCAELRPGILDDLGLPAAMEWQANETAKRTGLRFSLSLPGDEIDLKDKLAVNYFRIFQELLTNITRHADASEVSVILRVVDTHLVMEVRDNGRGISQDKIDSSLSFGIMGIKERARFFNGEFEIRGESGKGTVAIVKTPLKGRHARHQVDGVYI